MKKEKVITLILVLIGIAGVAALIASNKIKLPHVCPDRTTSFPFPRSIALPDGVRATTSTNNDCAPIGENMEIP